MGNQGEEVDINFLIRLYHRKISELSNQVILLEATVQTLRNEMNNMKTTPDTDFKEE
jgi:outer membrane murein-binding lipoprotein Lpp